MAPLERTALGGIRRLAGAALLCGAASLAFAQAQPAQKPAPGKAPARPAAPAARVYYDIYEPLQRPRLKRETCMKSEESVGAYCVKKCNPSYELKSNIRPMRCVGTRPLPPGMLPGPIRSDRGEQPMPPIPDKPLPPKQGA